jgi:F-type H+-transporting ATPase subunit delta
MREPTIARNYAETLLELARKDGDMSGWGDMIRSLSDGMDSDRRLKMFLESPRVSVERKNEIIDQAVGGGAPRNFVRFLKALVHHRRQMLIPAIAASYDDLLDEVEGRVHAAVTVAREPDEADRAAVTQHLAKSLGKEVVPHFSVNPALLGGVVVRVGDTVLDGSVRRRLATLRARMLASR